MGPTVTHRPPSLIHILCISVAFSPESWVRRVTSGAKKPSGCRTCFSTIDLTKWWREIKDCFFAKSYDSQNLSSRSISWVQGTQPCPNCRSNLCSEKSSTRRRICAAICRIIFRHQSETISLTTIDVDHIVPTNEAKTLQETFPLIIIIDLD